MRGIALALTGALLNAGGALAASVDENYMRNCAVCHLPGIAGAPKVGDKDEWSRRIRPGLSMVYRNALEGIPNTAMAAKGGHTDLSDDEIRAIVDYMVEAARIDADVMRIAQRYEKLGITDREFIRLDRNFDGQLSVQELGADTVLVKNIKRFDRNRDDRLDPKEYREAEATLERERIAVDVPDDALVKAVRTALTKVSGVDLPNTKVEAKDGTVSIVGIVEHAEVAKQAQDVVKRIGGIKKIDNRLVSGHQMAWD